jgi:urease accessory protein
VFARRARGEAMTGGALRDRWNVRSGGKLVWADAFVADPLDDALLDRPALLGGARACATLVCACAAPDRALEIARDRDGVACGLVGGLLVARLLDRDVPALRERYLGLWQALRAGLFGLPDRLSRLWHA